MVWEIFQGGRSFIDPAIQESHVSWLNGLPQDELLLQALQTFEKLPTQGIFPRRVIRAVLEGSLRDKPEHRIKSQDIVDIFHSDKTFSHSDRTTYSYLNPSKIPPLPKWSFIRTDNLAETVPFILQTAMFAQLKSEVDCPPRATHSSTHLHLAMCHLTGFGTCVNLDKFLDHLTEGALCGDLSSAGLCLRMHSALHAPMTASLSTKPIIRVEHDLTQVSRELYYSYRVREHDKLLQKATLTRPFDLFAGTELLKRNSTFEESVTASCIATNLRDSSKDGAPLRVVFEDDEDSDIEGFGQLYHLAARLGLIDVVQAFLGADFDVNSRDENRATPLIAACRGGHAEVVRLLIDHGADPWKQQRNGVSALHWLMMFEDDQVHGVLEILTRTHNAMVMDSVVVEPVEIPARGLQLRWSPVHFAVAA